MEFDAWLFGLAMAVFSGFFQALKRPIRGYELPKDYYLFIILIMGPLIGVGLGYLQDPTLNGWNQDAMLGLLAGLSSAGLYAGVATSVKATTAVVNMEAPSSLSVNVEPPPAEVPASAVVGVPVSSEATVPASAVSDQPTPTPTLTATSIRPATRYTPDELRR